MQRREWLKQAGAGSVAAFGASAGLADSGGSVADTIATITGEAEPRLDDRVQLHVPSDAANGAVVPVGVASLLPDTRKIVLLLSGHSRTEVLELDTHHQSLQPRLSTHLQLTEPATITALVQSASGWYASSHSVTTLADSC